MELRRDTEAIRMEQVGEGSPMYAVSKGEPEKTARGTARLVPLLGSGLAVEDIVEWARRCFPRGAGLDQTQLGELIAEANHSVKNEFAEADAIRWAAGYRFSEALIRSDAACLSAAALYFTKMIRRRLIRLSPNRLSRERAGRLHEDNPEKVLMVDLAEGMRVHLPENFVPNGKHDMSPLRESYLRVSSAVNRMLGGLVEQGLAVLLDYKTAIQHVPRLHFGKAHWTAKKGKPSGRPLGDLTYVEGTPLNTAATADQAALYYGHIAHPTIDEIAMMIVDYYEVAKDRDPNVTWNDMYLWKMDLKGAYQLLLFRPEDVGLFAMRLSDDLVYLQLVGIFGWSGTPAAFQVVTRAVQWELGQALEGSTLMYVDDIIGVCLRSQVVSELEKAKEVRTDLLGPDAVADEKTEHGRHLEILGYTIDMDIKRVLIAKKNHLKALHSFLSVNVNGSITLRTAQQLASYGSRYGRICRVMRPFAAALHRMTMGRTSPHAAVRLSAEARFAIQCWKAALCLVKYDEVQFTRALSSFHLVAATVVAEFDASLTGIGVIWYQRVDGAEVVLGVCALSTVFLDLRDDSSYQNFSEFLGALIAVVGFARLGFAGHSLKLRGDSVTALTWAITERPRGVLVTNAAMAWTLTCIAADVHIIAVTHIPGVLNDNCDRLSRRSPSSEMSVVEEAATMGLTGAREVEMEGDQCVRDLLLCCDPAAAVDSEAQFMTFWNDLQCIVSKVIRPLN